MNGMIFHKDWTPHVEHFILTFCHQECWHHLNSAGILPRASWARFIFFTTFYLRSGETHKAHKSTRISRYLTKELAKPPTDTSSAREKHHDDLSANMLLNSVKFQPCRIGFIGSEIRKLSVRHPDQTNTVHSIKMMDSKRWGSTGEHDFAAWPHQKYGVDGWVKQIQDFQPGNRFVSCVKLTK